MASGVRQHHLMDESVDQCLTIERSLQKFLIHLRVIHYIVYQVFPCKVGLRERSALFCVEWISLVCVHSYSRTPFWNHSGTILEPFYLFCANRHSTSWVRGYLHNGYTFTSRGLHKEFNNMCSTQLQLLLGAAHGLLVQCIPCRKHFSFPNSLLGSLAHSDMGMSLKSST